jgi:hypothetical protein
VIPLVFALVLIILGFKDIDSAVPLLAFLSGRRFASTPTSSWSARPGRTPYVSTP